MAPKFTALLLCLAGVVPSHPPSRVPSSAGASPPPDGTTFRHLALGEKQTRLIPAYSFWNFQVGDHPSMVAFHATYQYSKSAKYAGILNLSTDIIYGKPFISLNAFIFHCSFTSRRLPTWSSTS